MSFKMTLAGAALTLSMAPLAARADDFSQQRQYDQQPYQQSYDQQQQYQQPYGQQPGIAVGEPSPYDRDGDRGDRGGRYEQRVIQRWVPGQYQQVWVPEQCSTQYGHRGWYRAAANVCIPAHYAQQWTPGHSESTQQWVWVPFGFHGRHHGWERGFYNRGI